MDKASPAISQVPVFMQTNSVYTSFTRQLQSPWNPYQSYYGNLHAPPHMKQPETNQPQSSKLEVHIATSSPALDLSVQGNQEQSLSESTLTGKSGEGSSETGSSLLPSESSGQSPVKASPTSQKTQMSSAPKKKKKKTKKPSLKAALNSDLPTMVPPLIDAVEKQHQCPDCPRRFSWQFQLQQHSRTHSGERPFVCPDCRQAYKRREHLQRHQRIHTGERPFECEECGKKYRRKNQLVRHARVHTGERPYNCVACNKNFRRRGHLLRHLKVHTPDILKEAGISLQDLSKIMLDCSTQLVDTAMETLPEKTTQPEAAEMPLLGTQPIDSQSVL